MSEIRRRKREEARALKEKKRQQKKKKRNNKKTNSILEELENSDDDEIKLERFPIFTPGAYHSNLFKNQRKKTYSDDDDTNNNNNNKINNKVNNSINNIKSNVIKRYSPGWKPKVKCPIHYRNRLYQQGYMIDPKHLQAILGRKNSVLNEENIANVGDLEMEMALFKSKKDDGLFKKQEMVKPPDKWVHYPRFKSDFLPIARGMASFTPTPSRGIFMFGGLASKRTNEMANLNPRSLKWRKVVSKQGKPPSARSGHSALCVQSKHSIYYYGGEEGSSLSDLSINSPKHLARNKKVPYHKRKSNKRESYVSEIPKNVIDGVTSDPKQKPNDRKLIEDDLMYAFDYRNETWEMLAPSPNPGPRYASSLTTLKQRNKALLFGGVSQIIVKEETKQTSNGHIHSHKTIKKKKRVYLDDIWMLDTHTVSFAGPLKTVGHRPSPRAGHSAICLNTSSLLLFGGMTQSNDVNDIYELKLTVEPMRWVCIHTHGVLPGPRICATAFLSPFDLSSIYVFGGTVKEQDYAAANDVLMYDHGTYRWEKVDLIGHVPEKRYWHMGCMTKGLDGDVKIGNEKEEDGTKDDEENDSDLSDIESIISSVNSARSKDKKNVEEASIVTEKKKDRFSMYIVGGTGDLGFVPFDVFALHIVPAPYQENNKGNMYSKLSFKWDSARHGLLRKPFKTWKLFVRNNQRKRAIEQQ